MYEKVESYPGLAAEESAVRLDSGEIIAVCVHCTAHPQGGVEIIARARALDESGLTRLDAAGAPIEATMRHAPSESDLARCGGIAAAQRCALMVALGENAAPLFTHAAHADALSRSSIRSRLQIALHSGPADIDALL